MDSNVVKTVWHCPTCFATCWAFVTCSTRLGILSLHLFTDWILSDSLRTLSNLAATNGLYKSTSARQKGKKKKRKKRRRRQIHTPAALKCKSENCGFQSHQSQMKFFSPDWLLPRAGNVTGPKGPCSQAPSTSWIHLWGCRSNYWINIPGDTVPVHSTNQFNNDGKHGLQPCKVISKTMAAIWVRICLAKHHRGD